MAIIGKVPSGMTIIFKGHIYHTLADFASRWKIAHIPIVSFWFMQRI